MSEIKIPKLQTLQRLFATMEASRIERFASAFDSEYPDVAKWIRSNGIPKQVLIPEGYVANAESLQPLVDCLEKWQIAVLKTPIIREAKIVFIKSDKTTIEVDLSDR